MGMGDFAFSMQMRDTIDKMVKNEIDRQRPKYRYAVVNDIDRLVSKCNVTYNGETDPVQVNMGAVQPLMTGQIVRIEGLGTDKYISDVLGPAYGMGVAAALPIGMIMPMGGANVPVGCVPANGAAISRTVYASLFAEYGTTYGAGDGSTTFNVPNIGSRVLVGQQAPVSLGTVTMTIEANAVFTKSGHGLSDGQTVRFTTTGALPTGIVAGTWYFMRDVSASQFRIATTLGGAAITTSGTQSGTHTLWSVNFEALGQTGGEVAHRLTYNELAIHAHSFSAVLSWPINATALEHITNTWGQSGWPQVAQVAGTNNAGWDQPHLNLPPYIVINYVIKAAYASNEVPYEASHVHSTGEVTGLDTTLTGIDTELDNIERLKCQAFAGDGTVPSIPATYTNMCSATGTMLAKQAVVNCMGFVNNGNSGAPRTAILRLTRDGVVIGNDQRFNLPNESGYAPGYGFSFSIPVNETAGEHTYALSAIASIASAVQMRDTRLWVTQLGS